MAGVDTPVEGTPRLWLNAPVVPPLPARVTVASKPAPVAACATAVAPTLDALTEAVAAFVHPLRRADLAPILVTGNTASRIVIMCDQPEVADSLAVILRTRMLAAIGLDVHNCVLLHRLPWPTTGARSPRIDELAAFAPFVGRALEIVAPRAILALGQHAAAIAGEPMALASARGRWASVTVGTADIPLLATCHPRLLLSQPARKREAWADLQAFAARLLETA